ncbi:MAG: hypothetical protein MI923_02920 [Phycisphaerales bacterium]|nr:hypothetical protein [Phycisphaerales bacterium]
MPIIDITLPEGALPKKALERLPETVGQIALKYEGLKGSPFAEAFTWVYTHEVPSPNLVQVSGKPPKPIYRFLFTTLQGLIDQESKHKLGIEVAKAIYEFEESPWNEEEAHNRVWVFFNDVREGDWIVGAGINNLPDLRARVEREKTR